MAAVSSNNLIESINNYMDDELQSKKGKEIDELLSTIGKTKFSEIEKLYKSEKKDIRKERRIKYIFTFVAISLAVVTVVCAIASFILSSGVMTTTLPLLAVATGIVGIASAFTQLDNAIYRYLSLRKERKKKDTVVKRLDKQFGIAKKLLAERISALGHIEKSQLKANKANEIFLQNKKLNVLIHKAKDNMPMKTYKFSIMDPSPILKHLQKSDK